ELVHVPLLPKESGQARFGVREPRRRERFRLEEAERADDAQCRDQDRAGHERPLSRVRALDRRSEALRATPRGLKPALGGGPAAAANAAPRIPAFEEKPANGGIPAIARVAIHMSAAVHGM